MTVPAHDPIHGVDAYSRDAWLTARLPWLQGLAPLLPGGPDKRPLVGDGWPAHPGLTIEALQAAAPACICWHIGASPHHIAVDIDGPAVSTFCRSHGCDPADTNTWRITRSGEPTRLKLVFTVTPEQRATLAAGGKTTLVDGQELAVFARPGTQIVVLGNHYTKASGHTQQDDQYTWEGRRPSEIQPLPPQWFDLLQGVFCGDRPLRPVTRRNVATMRRAPRTTGGSVWLSSSERTPCPICGRRHSGGCAIHQDGNATWCLHGQTCSAPDCGTAGEQIAGHDGRVWAYVRSADHDSFGERSLFALHRPRPPREPVTPPMDGEPFIPPEAPSPAAAAPVDDDERAEQQQEIQSFREGLAHRITVAQLFPPGIADTLEAAATQQGLEPMGYVLPLLTTAASIIGNRLRITPEPGHAWSEPAILWGLNIAPAGGGKSPISGATIEDPLRAWEIRERERHAEAMRRWRTQRAQAERDAKARASEVGGDDLDPLEQFLADNPQPERRHLVVQDATFEKLEIILGNGASPGLLAYHDEMGQWFSQLTRAPNQSDRAKWLQLFPGSSIRTDRVGRADVFVPYPACSVMGNLQPARIQALWAADAKANDGQADADGLWSRFLTQQLPAWHYRYRSQTANLAPVLASLYQQIDAGCPAPAAEQERPHQLVTLEPAALVMFRRWIDDLSDRQQAATTAEQAQFMAKGRGLTLRLALVLHAIRQASCGLPLTHEIPEPVFGVAVLLMEHYLHQREALLAELVADSTTALVKRLLAKGVEWQRTHGARPVPQATLRLWALPTRAATSQQRRDWLAAVTSSPNCGRLVETARSFSWQPPEGL